MTPTFDFARPAEGITALHDLMQTFSWPMNAAASITHSWFNNAFVRAAMPGVAGNIAGFAALAERMTRDYKKPGFHIGGASEDIVMTMPFCDLRHFKTPGCDHKPKILLVAPMSGHHATLLRETVAGLAKDHDVYITDWKDAADVPLSAGKFDLDDYITYTRRMITAFHGDVHVMAVCQPGVAALAAISVMEAQNDPFVPKSLTLMGSPIDTRISPTSVDDLATKNGLQWFHDNVKAHVPMGHPGAGRAIYPGILQLMGFMSMNADRHVKSHMDLFNAAARGDSVAMRKFDIFNDEYKSVMNLDWDFYIQTIKSVFIDHDLPKGQMIYTDPAGKKHNVDPANIKRVALMTVEGEKDDITGDGQCRAAHDLCVNLPQSMHTHYRQAGAGHYGIFSGSKWISGVLPYITQFAHNFDGDVRERVKLPRYSLNIA